MIYDLAQEFDRNAFVERAKYLAEKRKGFVELTEKVQRSLSQNAYCHTIVAYLALNVGCTAQYAKDNYFKTEANADLFVRKIKDPIYGNEKTILRSTQDLTKEEMSVAIDRFMKWCSSVAGVYIPPAEEHKEMVRMQYEVERAKRYL